MSVCAAAFCLVASDAQGAVCRFKFDVAAQKRGFQFRLDGDDGFERDDFEVVVADIPKPAACLVDDDSVFMDIEIGAAAINREKFLPQELPHGTGTHFVGR